MLILKNLTKNAKKSLKNRYFLLFLLKKEYFLGFEKIKVQKNIFIGNKNYFC